MTQDYIWFLTEDNVLTGIEACRHMQSLMNNYQVLIDDISYTLNRCLKYNHVSEEESFPNTVLFTSEQLSMIEIELELLIQRIAAGLEDR